MQLPTLEKLFTFSFLLIFFLLAACGEEDDEEDTGGSQIESVNNANIAEWVVETTAEHIAQRNVLDRLSNGDFMGEVLYGDSGTATVNGSESYTGTVSCGTDCVSSTYEATISVSFDNYRVTYSNGEYTINGSINYSEYRYSRQSGLSYSSSESYMVESVNPVYVRMIYDGSWGYEDTVTFRGSSSRAPYLMSGWCSASNGVTYNF